MDVLVTSKCKATPCMEWSKTTGRKSPIPGVTNEPTLQGTLTINPGMIERHKANISFSAQLPRVMTYVTSSGRNLAGVHNCDVLSTHSRSSACSTYMKPPTQLTRPVNTPKAKGQKSIAEEECVESEEELAKLAQSKERGQRIHVQYEFDKAMNSVKPTSRSVNMHNMRGRTETPPPCGPTSIPAAPNPFSSFNSRHRRATGGDFGKAPGRVLHTAEVHPERDIKWRAVDKHIRGTAFPAAERYKMKPDPSEAYLHTDPLTPLCTRWKGTAVQAWYDSAYSAVQSRPPSVAAPRAGTGSTSAVIKSANAQLGMLRSTLLKHAREGERKKKERLGQYSADMRMAERDLSPAFQSTYSAM